MSLDGKNVILFGAGALASGYAPLFAREGANLMIVGIQDTAKKLAEKLQMQESRKVIPIDADVTNHEKISEVYTEAERAFGTIDVVVNGAGGNKKEATVTSVDEFINMKPEDMHYVFDSNFWSKVYSIQRYAKHLVDNNHTGRVVNITSMGGIKPLSRVMYYDAAFGAVENYLGSAAHFYGALGIGEVNNIAFGFTVGEQNRRLLLNDDGSLTERGQEIIQNTALGRFLTPEELAPNVIHLADRDRSPGVTGATFRVDGGYNIVNLAGTAGYTPKG